MTTTVPHALSADSQTLDNPNPNHAEVNPSAGNRIVRKLITLTGPVMRPLAGRSWFPLWAVIHHRGRRTGIAYATPIVARPTAEGFAIPLPFGAPTQWARNVLAAGEGTIRWAGADHHVTDPEIISQAGALPAFSPPLRAAIRLIGIGQFLRVRRVT